MSIVSFVADVVAVVVVVGGAVVSALRAASLLIASSGNKTPNAAACYQHTEMLKFTF
jgi:hypothetical protein